VEQGERFADQWDVHGLGVAAGNRIAVGFNELQVCRIGSSDLPELRGPAQRIAERKTVPTFAVPGSLCGVAREVVPDNGQAFQRVPVRSELGPGARAVDMQDERKALAPRERALHPEREGLQVVVGAGVIEAALSNRDHAFATGERGERRGGRPGVARMHAYRVATQAVDSGEGARGIHVHRGADDRHVRRSGSREQRRPLLRCVAVEVDVGIEPGRHGTMVPRRRRPERVRGRRVESPAMGSYALRGGLVWDGLADAAAEGTIVVDGDRIAAADGSGEAVDISGCTVMPGLIEGHAHLCFDATPGWRTTYDTDSPARMLLRMAESGRRMVRAGITTVRDLGAPTDLSIELRDAIAGGLAEGPRLLVAGAPITTTGGHCWFMGGECDGETGIRKNVREHVKAGTDWIKVMATGGNMTPRTNTFAPQFTVDELRALIEEAHRLRRKVAAHAHGVEGIRVATEAGVDCIEHCSFTTPGGYAHDQALIDRIKAGGILVSPTVSVGFRNWPDDGRKQQRGAVLKALLDSGCKVLMSTDCGIPGVPHEALGGGLEVLQEATGYPPVEILKLATSRSAELLDLPDRGVIEPGRLADLLIVDGDPTRDLGALSRVRMVIQGGEVVFAAR